VARSYLNQILLELFKLLGNSSTASVDFEHKNGNKGCAIIVPRVKNEENF
jgi:hypothetical protein